MVFDLAYDGNFFLNRVDKIGTFYYSNFLTNMHGQNRQYSIVPTWRYFSVTGGVVNPQIYLSDPVP